MNIASYTWQLPVISGGFSLYVADDSYKLQLPVINDNCM